MLTQARTGAAGADRMRSASSPLCVSSEGWLLIALTIVAAALRFATIRTQSYWVDESQAAHEMQLSFGGMLSAWSSSEWNPPLYFVVLWPWAKLFGTSEAALRSFSALLGTAYVPLVYACARELVSRRAGLAAAALAALSPFMIWYSQEAREYMLLMVLCAGSLLFFARAWRTPRPRTVVWWAVLGALAMLTQYFAGFLVAAEGLALLYRYRSRTTLTALAALAALAALLVPHVVPRLDHPTEFIVSIPLSIRLQQVPVTFAMNTLYQSSIVSYGLIGAAALAAALIALLVIGADASELRGAGLAAGLAAAALLIPLLLALLGHDDFIARAVMPGWIPLVVVIAAACTASRARRPGGALLIVLLAASVYAGIRIAAEPQFQRPNWRGVATALGHPTGQRAIVASDGQFASGPLSIYLPGAPWSGPGRSPSQVSEPANVSEVDLVANRTDTLATLPPGMRIIDRHIVDGYQVTRFALARPWHLGAAEIGARVSQLLESPSAGPSVIVQPASA